jgi:hypothetical protein
MEESNGEEGVVTGDMELLGTEIFFYHFYLIFLSFTVIELVL